MKILICNAGSTSLKFKLWDMPSLTVLAEGKVERVGSDDAIFHYASGAFAVRREGLSIPDYSAGIGMFLRFLSAPEGGAVAALGEIEAVGFKTVLAKGYYGVHFLTEAVLDGMRAYLPVAPAHNGPYLEAIAVFEKLLPDAPRVGVFETAFHRTIPLARRVFPVPYEWYEKYGVMRMGYHGASHGYIADVLNGKKADYAAISCHLGGSCSVCAIDSGKSVDTSFGMSLESGLIHANRVGDMDTSMSYFLRDEGLSDREIAEGVGRYFISAAEGVTANAIKKRRRRILQKINKKSGVDLGLITVIREAFRQKSGP